MTMHFLQPGWFWMWLLLPVFLGLLWRLYLQHLSVWSAFLPEIPIKWLRWKYGLRALSVVSLFLALPGPYLKREPGPEIYRQRSLLLVVDLSASMRAQDVQPDRFSKAKSFARALVDSLQGERFGILVFSGFPDLVCPLTSDARVVDTYLALLEPRQLNSTATNYRRVLRRAHELFETDSLSSPGTRAVLLLTDGDNAGESFLSVVHQLERQGTDLFPVVLGTEQGATIPLGSEGVLKDPETRRPVITRIRPQFLASFASGAQIFTPDNLPGLVEAVHSLAAHPVGKVVQPRKWQLAGGLLLGGFLCLMGSLVMLPHTHKASVQDGD